MEHEWGHQHRHNLRNLRFSLPLTLVRRALRWERHATNGGRRDGRALAARVVKPQPQQSELPQP